MGIADHKVDLIQDFIIYKNKIFISRKYRYNNNVINNKQ